VQVAGRTPWQLFWLRFRRHRVARAAFAFIVLLTHRYTTALLSAVPATRARYPGDAGRLGAARA
jgi:hypothetical protein